MGIPTLIKTQTASDSAYLDFIDGTSDVVFDSTYDEYMFVFTDINPATNYQHLAFQVNATDDAGGDFDTSLITSSFFRAVHGEDASPSAVGYVVNSDLGQSASFQVLTELDQAGNGSDESSAGILHIFSPSNTTYVKHFYSRMNVCGYVADARTVDCFTAGYIDDTTAIDEIRFKMYSGNFDGVIQMYGIS